MAYPILWSPKAQANYLAILADWHSRSLDFALKLDDAVEVLLQNLTQFKDFCPSSAKRPLFRKCVIVQRYSLIYRHNDDTIWIVDVLDNKGKPRY